LIRYLVISDNKLKEIYINQIKNDSIVKSDSAQIQSFYFSKYGSITIKPLQNKVTIQIRIIFSDMSKIEIINQYESCVDYKIRITEKNTVLSPTKYFFYKGQITVGLFSLIIILFIKIGSVLLISDPNLKRSRKIIAIGLLNIFFITTFTTIEILLSLAVGAPILLVLILLAFEIILITKYSPDKNDALIESFLFLVPNILLIIFLTFGNLLLR
jgi:hypothetical protein